MGRTNSELNAGLIPLTKLKSKTQNIKTFSSNLAAYQKKAQEYFGDTKIFRTQTGKTHNVLHTIKYYQA